MTRIHQTLLAATVALTLGSGVASASMMDNHATGAERAPDVNIVVLDPNGMKHREFNYYLSEPAAYHAEAASTIASNPALAAALHSRNVEMNNVLGVQQWGNGSYTVFLR